MTTLRKSSKMIIKYRSGRNMLIKCTYILLLHTVYGGASSVFKTASVFNTL